MKTTKYTVLAALAVLSLPALADMYKCSTNGVVAYQHTPCAESAEQSVIKEKKTSKTVINANKEFESIMNEHSEKSANMEASVAEKLRLIDERYALELQQAEGDEVRTRDIENKKRQAKLPIYKELAGFYEDEQKKLGDLHETESQAARDSRKALVDLEKSHKEELRKIDEMFR